MCHGKMFKTSGPESKQMILQTVNSYSAINSIQLCLKMSSGKVCFHGARYFAGRNIFFFVCVAMLLSTLLQSRVRAKADSLNSHHSKQ